MDDVIIISHATYVLTTKMQFFAKKLLLSLNTSNFTMDLRILEIPIAKCCFLPIFNV